MTGLSGLLLAMRDLDTLQQWTDSGADLMIHFDIYIYIMLNLPLKRISLGIC